MKCSRKQPVGAGRATPKRLQGEHEKESGAQPAGKEEAGKFFR